MTPQHLPSKEDLLELADYCETCISQAVVDARNAVPQVARPRAWWAKERAGEAADQAIAAACWALEHADAGQLRVCLFTSHVLLWGGLFHVVYHAGMLVSDFLMFCQAELAGDMVAVRTCNFAVLALDQLVDHANHETLRCIGKKKGVTVDAP